jgi:drug/metabolite transporter (DMT)-like permease
VEANKLGKFNDVRLVAILLQIAAAVLWSFGGMLIKLVELHPIAITGIRSTIAALVILPFLKRSAFKLTRDKIFGGIAYASMVLLFVSATKSTTAANAILLQYTSPIYIAIFGGWLLKERAKLKDWITIVFVIGGMVLFFIGDIGGGSIKGNILGILSGVALAFNTIFMRRQKHADPLENVFWGSIITILASLPFMFRTMPSTSSWIGLMLLGVFQLGLSYVIYAKAIKNITALESTFISLVEPLLNPIWVFLSVGEVPTPLSIVGGLVVLISITLNCLQPKKVTTNSCSI